MTRTTIDGVSVVPTRERFLGASKALHDAFHELERLTWELKPLSRDVC